MPWHDWVTLLEFFVMLLSPCAVAYHVCKQQEFNLDYSFKFDFEL